MDDVNDLHDRTVLTALAAEAEENNIVAERHAAKSLPQL